MRDALRYVLVPATDEQRKIAQESPEYQHGDMVLAWVNEGDLADLTISLGPEAANRIEALEEALRIAETLYSVGFTQKAAQVLGDEALSAYLKAGSTGLANWARDKRRAALSLPRSPEDGEGIVHELRNSGWISQNTGEESDAPWQAADRIEAALCVLDAARLDYEVRVMRARAALSSPSRGTGR